MKLKVAEKLKPGEEVTHRRYGVAEVKKVLTCGLSFFGVVFHVKTDEGRKLLSKDCGAPIPDLLVDNPRSLQ